MILETENNISNKGGNRRPKFILVFLSVITFLSIILILAYQWTSDKIIKEINVSGNYLLNENVIKDNYIDSLINKSSDDINIHDIHQRVIANPFISAVNVTHSNVEKISIEVKERNIVAALIRCDGSISFVDSIGFIPPYNHLVEYSNLPLIRKIDNNGFLDTNLLMYSINIINTLNKGEYNIITERISEIIYNHEINGFEFTTDEPNQFVILGEAQDIDSKLIRYQEFIKHSSNQNFIHYRKIDLRWNNRVVVQFS